jgi:hypothetical protein
MNNKYPTTKPSLNLDFANTKSLDPRITFRRGTPGTYYDGVTHVKAEENLIYPSIPDSNWTANEYSIATNSVIAPDGTTTASKIVLNNGITGSYNIEKLANVSINNFYTFSIHAKAGEFSIFNFDTQDSYFAQVNVVVDLSTGSIIEKGVDVIDSSITDVGNGWYRIVMTGVAIATGSNKFIIRNFEDTGDGSSGFYLWGAQLEQRDTVTAYTATNGTPITKYQPKLMTAAADHARFDHDPITGESKGLLIEESRTNLAWHSVDFGERAQLNGLTPLPVHGWMYVRCSIDTNGPMSPDGTRSVVMNHDTTETNGGGLFISGHSDYDDKYIPAGTNTYSFYAKNAGVNFFVMNTGGNKIFFDLTNGTAKSFATLIDSYGIEHVGNGWYRCHVVTSQATGLYFYQSDQDDDGTQTVSGAGGVAVWGPQFEQGSFPTSYIKTSGASATRSADNASITGENFSSWYRQDEGTLYVENSTFDPTPGRSRISFGSPSDRIFMANGTYSLYVQSGGDVQVSLSSSVSTNKYVKRAVGLKKNDFAVCFDRGSNILTDSDGSMPFVDNLKFRDESGVENHTNGHIKKLAYYPQRLTNEQLQNLTK